MCFVAVQLYHVCHWYPSVHCVRCKKKCSSQVVHLWRLRFFTARLHANFHSHVGRCAKTVRSVRYEASRRVGSSRGTEHSVDQPCIARGRCSCCHGTLAVLSGLRTRGTRHQLLRVMGLSQHQVPRLPGLHPDHQRHRPAHCHGPVFDWHQRKGNLWLVTYYSINAGLYYNQVL